MGDYRRCCVYRKRTIKARQPFLRFHSSLSLHTLWSERRETMKIVTCLVLLRLALVVAYAVEYPVLTGPDPPGRIENPAGSQLTSEGTQVLDSEFLNKLRQKSNPQELNPQRPAAEINKNIQDQDKNLESAVRPAPIDNRQSVNSAVPEPLPKPVPQNEADVASAASQPVKETKQQTGVDTKSGQSQVHRNEQSGPQPEPSILFVPEVVPRFLPLKDAELFGQSQPQILFGLLDVPTQLVPKATVAEPNLQPEDKLLLPKVLLEEIIQSQTRAEPPTQPQAQEKPSDQSESVLTQPSIKAQKSQQEKAQSQASPIAPLPVKSPAQQPSFISQAEDVKSQPSPAAQAEDDKNQRSPDAPIQYINAETSESEPRTASKADSTVIKPASEDTQKKQQARPKLLVRPEDLEKSPIEAQTLEQIPAPKEPISAPKEQIPVPKEQIPAPVTKKVNNPTQKEVPFKAGVAPTPVQIPEQKADKIPKQKEVPGVTPHETLQEFQPQQSMLTSLPGLFPFLNCYLAPRADKTQFLKYFKQLDPPEVSQTPQAGAGTLIQIPVQLEPILSRLQTRHPDYFRQLVQQWQENPTLLQNIQQDPKSYLKLFQENPEFAFHPHVIVSVFTRRYQLQQLLEILRSSPWLKEILLQAPDSMTKALESPPAMVPEVIKFAENPEYATQTQILLRNNPGLFQLLLSDQDLLTCLECYPLATLQMLQLMDSNPQFLQSSLRDPNLALQLCDKFGQNPNLFLRMQDNPIAISETIGSDWQEPGIANQDPVVVCYLSS